MLRQSTRIAPGLDESRVSLANQDCSRSSSAREGAKSAMFAAPPQPASDASISASRSSGPTSWSKFSAAVLLLASAAYSTSARTRSGCSRAKRMHSGPPHV